MLTHEVARRYDPLHLMEFMVESLVSAYRWGMKQRTGTALGAIALGSAVVTALLGPAAIFLPLLATLALAYFAFTTPPPPTAHRDERIVPQLKR